jgi:membrane protease YdiL (CAAX protease family)
LPIQEIIATLAELSGVLAVTMILGLSPRIQNVAPVGFKYPNRETKFAFILSAVLLFLTTIFYFFQSKWVSAIQFGIPNELNDFFRLAFISIIAFLASMTLIRVRMQPWRSIGWHTGLTRPAIQFGLALLILTLFLQGKFFSLFNGLPQTAIWALILSLVICLGEETVFRGFIFTRLDYRYGTFRGLLISTAIYILWRLPFLILLGWASQTFWMAFVFLVLQSLLLGWIMKKSRHVMVPALYHAMSMWIAFL